MLRTTATITGCSAQETGQPRVQMLQPLQSFSIAELTCALEQAFQLSAISNSLRRLEHSYGRSRFLQVKPLLAAVVQRCGQEFLYPVRPAVFQNFTHDVGPEVTIAFELCLIEKLVRRCIMGERIVCGRIC